MRQVPTPVQSDFCTCACHLRCLIALTAVRSVRVGAMVLLTTVVDYKLGVSCAGIQCTTAPSWAPLSHGKPSTTSLKPRSSEHGDGWQLTRVWNAALGHLAGSNLRQYSRHQMRTPVQCNTSFIELAHGAGRVQADLRVSAGGRRRPTGADRLPAAPAHAVGHAAGATDKP